MLIKPNVGELCSQLINELYGELPSRIFSALTLRGRCTIPQLQNYTDLNKRQLRHGLAVLIQHSLLFFHVDDNGQTFYEANVDNAYNLFRAGKILDMVETSFGPTYKDVMQNLLLLGQTRVSDFIGAYEEKINRANQPAPNRAEDDAGGLQEANGVNGLHVKKSNTIKSKGQLLSIISRLIEAELIENLHPNTFESPEDTLRVVEKQVNQLYFKDGVKGAKQKLELEEKIAEGLRKVRNESQSLKRKLEESGAAAKRRKVFENGTGTNGVHDDVVIPGLDASKAIRINYEKCLVELRNRRLVQYATDTISETTGYVYAVLLKQLTKKLPRCRSNPKMDIGEDDESTGRKVVTTNEILDNLKTAVDLSLGLGKTTRERISNRAAEKIVEHPPKDTLKFLEAEVDGNASSDEEEEYSDTDEEEYDDDYKENVANGTGGKVKFDGSAEGGKSVRKFDRPGQLRQHLLKLAESNQGFVRHCGPDEWTVDFEPLMRGLREAELDVVIEQTCGPLGLRLARILRSKGKLDEKAIPQIALIPKQVMQVKLQEMEALDLVHIQEVPKDNKADVKKSFFLWYCDVDRSLNTLLLNSYKTMVRILQTLERLRQNDKDVLFYTKRSDVRGKEKDTMQGDYYERFARFLENERKLMGQLARVDDVVALLNDF